RSDLRSRMAELLPRILAVILEQAHILDAGVALQVENALRGQAQEMCDLFVACVPQLPVVARILDQHLMRPHGTHAVIEAVAAPAGLALNMVKRRRMHYRTRRPWHARSVRRHRDHLRAVQAEAAGTFGARPVFGGIISNDDPRTRDGILAEFHKEGEHSERTAVNPHFGSGDVWEENFASFAVKSSCTPGDR